MRCAGKHETENHDIRVVNMVEVVRLRERDD